MTPLYQKLGFKPDMSVFLYNEPEDYFRWVEVAHLKISLNQKPEKDSMDLIHGFFKEKKQLENDILLLKSYLKKEGLLWISWPKVTSKVETDINREIVREIGLETNLVDVKVASFNNVWSGLKFVYRKKDR